LYLARPHHQWSTVVVVTVVTVVFWHDAGAAERCVGNMATAGAAATTPARRKLDHIIAAISVFRL